MATYKHGVYTSEQATSMTAPVTGTAGLQVVVGTAPVNMLEHPEQAVNTPLLVYNYKEAVAAVGYHDDFAAYTLCESISAAFSVVGTGPLVLINVLDPAKHTADIAETTVQVNSGVAVLGVVGALLDKLTVKSGSTAMTRDTEFGVVEMGASACGEIALLASIAEPNYGILTNIGRAHLEGFGGPEGIRRGKGELLDYLAANGGRAFVPREDQTLTNMAAERDGLAAEYYSVTLADGIAHHLEGDYNRFNIAAAVAVGRYFDIDGERIRHAVGSYMPDNNRSQRTETGRNTLIVDCYNANPSSMRASVLNFLAEPAGGRSRRVLILGDMLELGAWSEQEHRDIVALASRNPDTELMLVGGEFARACAGMEPQPANTALFPSREELIAELRRRPVENAFVLVKGSRGIGLEKALEEL